VSVFVIAEAGVNHNGRLSTALQLVSVARQAKADAIKFQTFRADALASDEARTVDYQSSSTGHASQSAMLRELELDHSEFAEISKACEREGIEFMSTAFDSESLEMLLKLGIRRIKVPSGEVTNWDLLEATGSTGLPVILSTGMCTLEEVEEAISVLAGSGVDVKDPERFCVLHCTSAYPTLPRDANLRAISTMKRDLGVRVGYSDHTEGTGLSVGAVALGASVIEKHFTISRSMPGPDHAASLEPDELSRFVLGVRDAAEALGDGVKRPMPSESEARQAVRRSVVLTRAKRQGETISADDLTVLRPATGIHPGKRRDLIDAVLTRDCEAGHVLTWDDLE